MQSNLRNVGRQQEERDPGRWSCEDIYASLLPEKENFREMRERGSWDGLTPPLSLSLLHPVIRPAALKRINDRRSKTG